MTITSTARWNGGSRDAVLKIAKIIKPIHAKYGGGLRIEQIHTGLFAGQWLVSTIYPDWESYGRATQSLANDIEHQKIRGEMTKMSHMDDRTVTVGLEF